MIKPRFKKTEYSFADDPIYVPVRDKDYRSIRCRVLKRFDHTKHEGFSLYEGVYKDPVSSELKPICWIQWGEKMSALRTINDMETFIKNNPDPIKAVLLLIKYWS